MNFPREIALLLRSIPQKFVEATEQCREDFAGKLQTKNDGQLGGARPLF